MTNPTILSVTDIDKSARSELRRAARPRRDAITEYADLLAHVSDAHIKYARKKPREQHIYEQRTPTVRVLVHVTPSTHTLASLASVYVGKVKVAG